MRTSLVPSRVVANVKHKLQGRQNIGKARRKLEELARAREGSCRINQKRRGCAFEGDGDESCRGESRA